MNPPMKKLCLAVCLLVLGCDNKKPEEKKDDTPTERLEAKPAPSPTAPTAPPTAETPTPAPGDVPAECTALKDMIAKMNACAKFDASAKTQLTKQADSLISSAGGAGVDKASLGTQCKGTADAIMKAGAAACGW
jgi:hypothetical protein